MTTRAEEPRAVDYLLAGGIVVTMDAAGSVILDGAVTIAGKEIVAVGPSDALRARFQAAEIVDCGGCVILPGLINAHAHAPMSLLRGLVADVQLDVWLYGYMFPVESHFADASFSYAGTRLSCAEMIRGGTTTFVEGTTSRIRSRELPTKRACARSSARR